VSKPIVTNLVLLLIALIWGVGFVPQRLGMDYVGPVAFNGMRFLLGSICLLPVLCLSKSVSLESLFNWPTLRLSVLLGCILFAGATLQQISIQFTSLANVAFISGLYVIVVPIIGFFIGYKYKLIVWFGGFIAIAGLYLMTGSNGAVALKGDLLALLGAVFWAVHMLVLAKKAAKYNQLVLAFYQFLYCGLFSVLLAAGFEDHLLPDVAAGYIWPLLNGVIVVGVAYTLQVFVMQHAEPFTAALILALEAVFGAMAGYFFFNEQLAAAALVGALMMLVGCTLAQLPGSQAKISKMQTS
jgi:drug/metabolite transporter (DMT)-like permease